MIIKILKSKYFSVALILFLFWIGYMIIGASFGSQIIGRKIDDLDKKVGEMEKNNKYLEKIVSYVKTPAFLEREARIKLNYKSPDETLVFVYRGDNSENQSAGEKNSQEDNKNIFHKIWLWLVR
jgi:cell division protein FtsB